MQIHDFLIFHHIAESNEACLFTGNLLITTSAYKEYLSDFRKCFSFQFTIENLVGRQTWVTDSK